MRIVYFATVAALALSQPVFAQEASVDASAVLPTIDAPVAQCRLVAEGTASGVCLASTQQLLDDLDGVDPAAVDQTIADFVVAIAPLVEDEVCNEADDEVAQSIRLAATRSTSADQVARLIDIADTVEACVQTGTAAIEPDPEPASAA